MVGELGWLFGCFDNKAAKYRISECGICFIVSEDGLFIILSNVDNKFDVEMTGGLPILVTLVLGSLSVEFVSSSTDAA